MIQQTKRASNTKWTAPTTVAVKVMVWRGSTVLIYTFDVVEGTLCGNFLDTAVLSSKLFAPSVRTLRENIHAQLTTGDLARDAPIRCNMTLNITPVIDRSPLDLTVLATVSDVNRNTVI